MITTHFINNKNRFFEHGDPKVTTLETVENEGGGASDTMKKNTIATRVLGSLLTLGTIASFAQPVFAQISEEAPISTTGEPIAQQVESAPNPNSVPIVPGQANQLGGIQQVQPTGNVYLPQQSPYPTIPSSGKSGATAIVEYIQGGSGTAPVIKATAGVNWVFGEREDRKISSQQFQDTLRANTLKTTEENANKRLEKDLELCGKMKADEAMQICSDKANDRYDKRNTNSQNILPFGQQSVNLNVKP